MSKYQIKRKFLWLLKELGIQILLMVVFAAQVIL